VKGEPARPFNKVETFASTAYGVAGKKGVIFSEIAATDQGPTIQMDAAFTGEGTRRGASLGKTEVYSLMEEPKKSGKFEPVHGLFEQRGEVSSPSGPGLKTDMMGDSMQRFVQGADQAKMLGLEGGRSAFKGGQKSEPNMLVALLPESKSGARNPAKEDDAFRFAFGTDIKQQSGQERRGGQDMDLGLGLNAKSGTDFGKDTSRERFIIPLGDGLGLNQGSALSLELKAGQMNRSRLKRGQNAGLGFDFGFGRGKQPPPEKFFAPPTMRGMELFRAPSTGGRKKKRGYYYLHKNPVMSAEEFLGFGSKRGRKRR